MSNTAKKKIGWSLFLVAAALLLSSCSPYASLNIDAPFRVGRVTINPGIGIGIPL
jgi:hypothetical protein